MGILSGLPGRLRRITTSGTYKPEIDGLRFWAILPVVLWHGIQRIVRSMPDLPSDERSLMLWVPEGRVGVMLFLTISGFIIAGQFARQREMGRAVDLRAYFYRRLTRIEPPYLLLLLVTYLFLTITNFTPPNAVAFWRGTESLGVSFLASVFYSHGLLFNHMPRLFPGGWSLEVEVQFYVIAPLLFLLLYKMHRVGVRLWVCGGVLILAFIISRYFDWLWSTAGPHRYTLLRYFFYFWLGTFLSQISVTGMWPALRPRVWDALAGISLLAFFWSGIAEHSDWGVSDSVLEMVRILAFFCMFGGALRGDFFATVCRLPWLALIGGACYSIYLTHVQVMQILTPVLAKALQPQSLWQGALMGIVCLIPAVLMVGLAFYALVERPFMIPGWPSKLKFWIKMRLGHSVPTKYSDT